MNYSTPRALNTASSAEAYGINWNELISSGGTVVKSTNEMLGSKTFFAPESKHTCSMLAKSSVLINVPLIEISPKMAKLDSTGLPSAIEHKEINVGNASLPLIPIP